MSLFTLRTATPRGDAVLGWSDIEAAGAIHSLIWSGKEFLNRADDGRLLQSAMSSDGLQENFNPTEGGALASIQFSAPSLSKLLKSVQQGNVLDSVTRMAFWKPVGGVQLSSYILAKRVVLGPNLITHEASFSTPANETHTQHQFEIVTGYMPPEFSRFLTFDRVTSRLATLSDGPGEQPYPVVFTTPDGASAMGVWVPSWGNTAPASVKGGYGRWRFPSPDNVVKWNVVQRVDSPAPGLIFPAPQVSIPYGSIADVMAQLCTARGLLIWQIRRLYLTAFKRQADAGGETYWTDQLQAGTSLASIAAAFIASAEYKAVNGTNTADPQALVNTSESLDSQIRCYLYGL